MTTYRIKKENSVVYEYDYPRSRFKNNTIEYNQDYYEKNKKDLKKKRLHKRILNRIEQFFDES